MKRPALHQRLDEEISENFSTSDPNSAHTNHEEHSSPFLQANYHDMDSETLSEGSQKIRKKRNTYQKISDEIRLGLLDAVKNGETLKSAAKRYKINYSSAKSILHTYRKEGRIHKKSAQERSSIKKKNSISLSSVSSELHMPHKKVKKESFKIDSGYNTITHSLASIVEENRPEISMPMNVDMANSYNNEANHMMKMYEGHYNNQTQYNEVNQLNFQEEQARRPDDYAQNAPRLFDNYQQNFNSTNYMAAKPQALFQDMPQYQNFSLFSNESNSFDDVDTRWHTKSSLPEDFTSDPSTFLQMKGIDDRIGRFESDAVFQNYGNEGNWGYFDAQHYMKEALKKNPSPMYPEPTMQNRKSSIDYF